MSPPRRRSARIAGATPAKPKATLGLATLSEQDASQRDQTNELTTPTKTRQKMTKSIPVAYSQPATPAAAPPTPSEDEMHPSRFHCSVAPPSSGLRLGFTDIKSSDQNSHNALSRHDATPTKVNLPSTDFTFSIARSAAAVELSDEAKKLMENLRDRAAQIKADLVAQREQDGSDLDMQRRIARPKAKSSRYSAAHMAEFRKMDSIENHPSLWRAQHWTPIVKGQSPAQSQLKRSPFKANLEGTPQSTKPSLKRSLSKAKLDETPNTKSAAKRKSSVADLEDDKATPSAATPKPSASKTRVIAGRNLLPFAKRLKRSDKDDISTARPAEEGSCSPQRTSTKPSTRGLTKSHSSLARLMSPTKSSLSHLAPNVHTKASLVGEPVENSVPSLAKSTSNQDLTESAKAKGLKRRILSPRSISKVASILKGSISKTAIPGPPPGAGMSQTPKPVRKIEKELPPLPLTTPRRKITKHVSFTPDTKRFSGIHDPHSAAEKAMPRIRFNAGRDTLNYPSLDSVLTDSTPLDDAVTYPDLHALEKKLTGAVSEDPDPEVLKPSVPGSFTFRTDHTIQFGAVSPSGFGARPGQSSVRHVSAAPKAGDMPGGFPAQPPSPTSHPDKENTAPSPASKSLFGLSHGMSNKKRHRASSDEEDAAREQAQRVAKKRKEQHVPEGHAVLAPRLMTSTPSGSSKKIRLDATPSRSTGRPTSRTPGSASPSKKRPVLSMSRLNALARPKQRA